MIDNRLPTFPGRPVHGPKLDSPAGKSMLDPILYGDRAVEPKWNGWRLMLDRVECIPWNRHGEILSIGDEFHKAIQFLHNLPASFPRYVDCECLERRHGFMRGSIIVLDVIVPGLAYPARRVHIEEKIPIFNESAHLFERDVVCATPHLQLGEALRYWRELQDFNRHINSTGLNSFFEGVVLKRLDSPYPVQRLNPERETPTWTKHRFV
jgi:ATP-dependent DNA ligase